MGWTCEIFERWVSSCDSVDFKRGNSDSTFTLGWSRQYVKAAVDLLNEKQEVFLIWLALCVRYSVESKKTLWMLEGISELKEIWWTQMIIMS